MNNIKYCVLSDVPSLDKQLPFKNQWLNCVGPFVCKSITIVSFVFIFLFYSPIVKAKYSRLLYWHALYLGQAENQYLSLARSFNEQIVAFHLIKTVH
jgi:hypothetical protein